MRTDDLIAQLSTGLEPVKTGAAARILVASAGVGVVASIALMLGYLGLRYDFATAISSFGLWMKVAYTFAIAGFGFWLVERAGRPGADMTRPLAMLALPVLAIALLAALQLSAPGADMNRIDTPFRLSTNGQLTLRFADVEVVPGTGQAKCN